MTTITNGADIGIRTYSATFVALDVYTGDAIASTRVTVNVRLPAETSSDDALDELRDAAYWELRVYLGNPERIGSVMPISHVQTS